MTHGDNKGLVMPPMVSQIQVVVIPCGIAASMAEEQRTQIYSTERALKENGIRVCADIRDIYSPGWKFNYYELKVLPFLTILGDF